MIDHFRTFLGMREDFCLFLFENTCRSLESISLEDLIQISLALVWAFFKNKNFSLKLNKKSLI